MNFFKFPSTPHLTVLAGVEVREDKVLAGAEQAALLRHDIILEEKVDGANLGISFDAEGALRVQNRGAYLYPVGADQRFPGQWRPLGQWLKGRESLLFDELADRYILFGEWCYARHSVCYQKLPDWFLAFDLFDKQAGRFLCVARRDEIIGRMRLHSVPMLARGRYSLTQLSQLLEQPAELPFLAQPPEGLYLRYDGEQWLEQRAKLVRAQFVQTIDEHWSKSAIQPNRVCYGQ